MAAPRVAPLRKLANVEGRACIVTADGCLDLESASWGEFSSLVDDVIAVLDAVAAWFERVKPRLDPALSTSGLLDELERLGPPVTRPVQLFAIGLNYADHADGVGVGRRPRVFIGPGWTITSEIEGLGQMQTTFVDGE